MKVVLEEPLKKYMRAKGLQHITLKSFTCGG